MTILFAYDGSESADAALRAAASILGAHEADATVISVWEPLLVEVFRASKFGPVGMPTNTAELDERAEVAAQRVAEQGAQLAGELGFHARPLAIADNRDVAGAIVAAADDVDADLIVLGARGLAGVRAYLGSVSNHVLQHAHRPLLVIPPKGAGRLEEGAHEEASVSQPA
jgi:nucleotide-binding universal stress UspA family protein